jgi:diacylglycerol kinase (ATP)
VSRTPANLRCPEIERLRNTALWSVSGLRIAWIEEKSLRQWTVANAASWIIIAVAGLPAVEAALLISLGAMTIIVELLNSAVEATVDYVSTTRHPLAKKAKDIASGAVLTTALTWALCWILIGASRLLG